MSQGTAKKLRTNHQWLLLQLATLGVHLRLCEIFTSVAASVSWKLSKLFLMNKRISCSQRLQRYQQDVNVVTPG